MALKLNLTSERKTTKIKFCEGIYKCAQVNNYSSFHNESRHENFFEGFPLGTQTQKNKNLFERKS
jgi:hypothetical protein